MWKISEPTKGIKWRNESVKRGQSDRDNELWYYIDLIDC